MLLLEDFCNQSPGLYALIILEETPSPLPVGGLADGIMELTRQQCVVLAPCYRLVILLLATDIYSLPGSPFRLGVSYQTRMETPLPEVHLPHYSVPDTLGPADA